MQWLNRFIGNLLDLCGLDTTNKIGGSIQFFLYDTNKIMVLLGVIIATVVGVPMYADIFGTIPIAETLSALFLLVISSMQSSSCLCKLRENQNKSNHMEVILLWHYLEGWYGANF